MHAVATRWSWHYLLSALLTVAACAGGDHPFETRPTVKGEPDSTVCAALSPVDRHGLNLVFYNDGYSDREAFLADVATMSAAVAGVAPFSTFSALSFFVIMGADPAVCQTTLTSSGRPQVKCSPEVNQYVTHCNLDNFRLIVLTHEPSTSYSVVSTYKSSLLVLPTANLSAPTLKAMFLHELGHQLGLVDEKARALGPVPADSAAFQPGPNCAPDVKTAQQWWRLDRDDPALGYYFGCAGNARWVRPTADSLMNSGATRPTDRCRRATSSRR